jgi:ligand-binding sensor domain-containing protein/signal transduction histidine kinase
MLSSMGGLEIHLRQKLPLLLLITFIPIIKLPAQNINFEHLSAQEGLSQVSVTCINQDHVGFLWLGTYDGLNRYDGYNFKVFKKEPKNPNSLSHNFVKNIVVDRKGILWVGTLGGGLNRYDAQTEQFIHYVHDPADSTSLSHDDIQALYEDASGTLWIGTWGGGLNKVIKRSAHDEKNSAEEGVLFARYRHDPQNPQSLISDKIAAIQEDKDGIFWIGTRAGISLFDPGTGLVICSYQHDPHNPYSLSNDNISSLSRDGKGNIWIGTWGGGLNKFDPVHKQFYHFTYNPDDPASISYDTIMRLFTDHSGNLWIGTWGGGLNKLSWNDRVIPGRSGKEVFIRYQQRPDDSQSLSGNSVYAIFEDVSGVFWIGVESKGLNKYDPEILKFAHCLSDPEVSNRLTDKIVYTIYKDQQDVLWIGTRLSGLIAFNLNNHEYTNYINDPNKPWSISNDAVRTIFENRAGNLWIGTEAGLNQYNRITNKFHRYYTNPADPGETNVYAIHEDPEGLLWIGTWGGGLSRFDPQTKTFTTYMHNPDDPTSISDNIIWCMAQDSFGRMWLGTDKGGLNRYDKKNNKFIRYVHDPNNTNSLSDNKILSMFCAANGDLWLGTTTGLNQLVFGADPEARPDFKNYLDTDGLFSNTIQSIIQDDKGDLWISNGDYLSVLNLKTHEIKGFNSYDKLKVGELCVNAVYKDRVSGKIYLGGANGFTVFHPDSILSNLIIPSVVITDFRIFNKSVPIAKKTNGHVVLEKSITESRSIKLPYDFNVFSIEFAALHFNSPKNNKYAYKLEKFEKDWNYVSSRQRIATYTNLDPGQYTFRVKASNNDGLWNNEGCLLEIIISPPFWQSWWFRVIILFALFSFIYMAYQIRTRQIRKRNRELASINTRLSQEIEERQRAEKKVHRLNLELEQRVRERTAELEVSNHELESFAYSVSHDLRAPLRGIQGFSHAILEDYKEKLGQQGKDYLQRINDATGNMSQLIDDLLKLSRITRGSITKEKIDLSRIAEIIIARYKEEEPQRKVEFVLAEGLTADGDANLMKVALENLLHNAWKFTSKREKARIEFGKVQYQDRVVLFIRDNGIGFDMKYKSKLFEPFQRLQTEFLGMGIGLATVERIINRHGGQIWAEGKVDEGAVFYFSL